MSRRRPYCWCRLGIACQKVGKGKNNPRREGKIFGEKKEPSSLFTNAIGLSDVVMGEVLLVLFYSATQHYYAATCLIIIGIV